jgi:hypothetical protein
MPKVMSRCPFPVPGFWALASGRLYEIIGRWRVTIPDAGYSILDDLQLRTGQNAIEYRGSSIEYQELTAANCQQQEASDAKPLPGD